MSRKQTVRNVRRVFYVFATIIILLGIANYARPLPSIAANPATLSGSIGTISLALPTDGASMAIGADGYGTLATQLNTQLPTASIAKLITALTVLNTKPLTVGSQGPTITITPQDVSIYNNYVAQDGSVVPVQLGEQLTEYQALQAMLLPSANNIADTLAIWAFGSLTSYAAAANQEVKVLGLTKTVVGTDASGLSPSTVSSPSDLITLGSDVMDNPVLAEIVGQSSATLPIAGQVANVNTLIGHYDINGIKTGNSDQALGNYLFSAPYTIGSHSITIIGAIMHAPDLQSAMNDAIPLLASAQRSFSLETPVIAGYELGSYTTPWGEKITAVAQHNLSIVAWKGTSLTPTLNLNTLTHSMSTGSKVGTIVLNSGTYKVKEAVVLKQTYALPSIWWRLTRH